MKEIDTLVNKNNSLYSMSISCMLIFYIMFMIYDRPFYLFIGSVTMLFFFSNRKENKVVKQKLPENKSIKTLFRRNKSSMF